MLKDKTYLSLWELMLTREPYCSEYKVSCLLMSFLAILFVLSNTQCLNYISCMYFSPQNILHLVHIMLVLPISAAVCERGFSAQKRIKSDNRASLHADTVEDLIRISVEGPSLADFDATDSVANWFSQAKRARRPNYTSWPSDGP